MRWVWKLVVPLVVVVAAGGYAASSLASSDLDEVTPRETIVIDDAPTPVSHHDDRPRTGEKGGDRGDEGRTTRDDDRVVTPDVDDLDDLHEGDDDDGGDDD